ncbi:MAG TPA: UDP-3-O-acyl-N-acetylglucosamine deacetylase, partial [Minicystis sp.]|nr:UDP-3-O-acyl-N-acetylglucosamine deacetylase [Minicystis sp.]
MTAGTRGRVLEGAALHRGVRTRCALARADGAITIAQRGAEASIDELVVVGADRGGTVATRDGRVRVELVEHLFAALGGLGVRDGVRVDVEGDELPLLDGGARAFADALLELDPPRAPPRLEIARAATLTSGRASYAFWPGDAVELDVAVDFRAPIGRTSARWSGDAADFVARIAPARTFA